MQEVHRKSMNFFMELVYRQVDCFKNQLVGTLVRKKYKICKKGWAEERGFLYQRVENEEQLAEAMKTFTQPEAMEQPVLMEVFSNKNKDARILKDYYHQLKQK